jgi:tRNA-modifying protein YgfZ
MPSTALRLEGRDALDVLHRIGTNAVADLDPGAARATLFCDFRGRLLHRAVVAVAADGAVWLLRDDAPGDELVAFVERHVFREELRIGDRSDDLAVRVAGTADLEPGRALERDGFPVALRLADGSGMTIEPASSTGDEPSAAMDARENQRIHAGRAAHGHEIRDEFNPFEVGLGGEVHLSKGCFTGQEALMRLITYDSVRRRLVVVEGAGRPPQTPADLLVDERRAGRLTSAAAAGGGGWIGLAVVANERARADMTFECDGGSVRVARVLAQARALGR